MESKYNRVNLSIEQLEMAIDLFLSKKSFVSALTLAGAAEEVLGQAVKRRGEENSLQEQYRIAKSTNWITPAKSWADFTTRNKNKVRNAVKHLAEKDNIEFVADIEDEALWMIVRATDNYRRLGFDDTDRMHEFDGWFYEHVVGI
ncbi:hypothetical protein MZJ28_001458 [Vibrio parahaemolyticus]|uniref:hypothetical protein n=1 Tax=Vibrio parahaemolyticus TaxID=670 RepID=UPI001130F6A7|nr:hypothetical protein [Vibrio parahaemolyticus]EGQ8136932.1 hypothetical protein [Vibrio parahaemolyticus]EGQ8148834.1 hypothetical protein [Vibrio parahaemolyticus]EGQ8250678.1 hypothetical protein [Vibrio parahaemolyticus]EGQ8265159.1 hypothetical protein [Vibrio parahaemolyticus]EGQ8270655.1 hypothetical protein [Vibrio parahaemolyticus]